MLRVIMGIMPFVQQLIDENPDASSDYIQTAFAICRLAAEVALTSGDEQTAGWAAGHAAMLVPGGTSEISSWAAGVIGKIKDESKRAFFETLLRDALASSSDVAPTVRQEQEIYRQMAKAQGINLDDPNDQIGQIVNIGITDFDPTRVLRHCQHFFVTVDTVALPGRWLALPTAGGKRLHCTLKNVAINGISLDTVYPAFKSRYCDGCESCLSHPPGWAYTHEWQRDQNELHKDLIET
jgi:hypothetical protein